MRRPDWLPAQQGVMLYMPSTRVSVAETEDSMARLSVENTTNARTPASEGARSQLSQISGTVVVSRETDTSGQIQIKDEPVDPDVVISREDSVETLTDDEGMVTITPESDKSDDLLAQLISAAGQESSRGDEHFVTAEEECDVDLASGGLDGIEYEYGTDRTDFLSSPLPSFGGNAALTAASEYRNATPDVEEVQATNYDSDRTDFLESPSPCVRKSEPKRVRKRTTSAVSRHFRRTPQPKKPRLPVRRLNLGNRLKKLAAKKNKSENALSLEHLRSVERAPPHKWTDQERELLCVIHRWYTGGDSAAERKVFGTLFNSMFGLDVPLKTVQAQFKSHLCLYGGDAYPVFGQVFSVPFDDPEGTYADARTLIEEEAVSLGLVLHQRSSDAVVSSGAARKAKSPQTRKTWEALVRKGESRASQVEEIEDHGPAGAKMGMPVCLLEDEEWELLTDVEEVSTHSAEDEDWEIVQQSPSPAHEPASARPHLAFRVWDSTSRSSFINGGFIAEAFVDWPHPWPAPIALDCPSGAGKILTVLHLSKQGGVPVFISTASSLLQALVYAMDMHQPSIAIIDLNAPSLQQEGKMHHAAAVFPWLKSQGLARWARYKGKGEYFAWADISREAVLQVFNVEELIDLLNSDTDCRELLRFDTFKPGAKTSAIAAALRGKNAMLNTPTARALGRTAKAFGMNRTNVTLEHLQDFVARVMDGWTIVKPDSMDMHTMSSLAVTFATAMGSHAGGYGIQQVMGAFVNGVDQGMRCIAHWSGSKSGSRRRRFCDA